MTELDRAIIKAYRYLARSSRSENEVRSYLGGKGFNQKVVSQVIGKLKEPGFIDDRKYAHGYVEKGRNEHAGILRLKAGLENKGIENKIVEKTLKKFNINDKSQLRDAEKLMKMKLKQLGGEISDKILKKIYYNLARQGFEEHVIEELLEKYKADFVI